MVLQHSGVSAAHDTEQHEGSEARAAAAGREEGWPVWVGGDEAAPADVVRPVGSPAGGEEDCVSA